MQKQETVTQEDHAWRYVKEFGPLIFKILKRFTAEDLVKAYNEKRDLTAELSQNQAYLKKLQLIMAFIPLKDKAEKALKSERWLNWFIDKPMPKKRRDLYLVFAFNPNIRRWFQRQWVNIVTLLFK